MCHHVSRMLLYSCRSSCCNVLLANRRAFAENASKRAKSILHAFKSTSQSSGSSKKIPIALSAVVHQQMRKVKGILHMQPNCRIASTIADTATLRAARPVTPCRVLPGPSGHGVSCPEKRKASQDQRLFSTVCMVANPCPKCELI